MLPGALQLGAKRSETLANAERGVHPDRLVYCRGSGPTAQLDVGRHAS